MGNICSPRKITTPVADDDLVIRVRATEIVDSEDTVALESIPYDMLCYVIDIAVWKHQYSIALQSVLVMRKKYSQDLYKWCQFNCDKVAILLDNDPDQLMFPIVVHYILSLNPYYHEVYMHVLFGKISVQVYRRLLRAILSEIESRSRC